jgi:hypothetical protein
MKNTRALALLVGISLSGCTYRLGDFTALSSKNVPLQYDATTTAEGSDCKVTNVLLIYLGPPSLEEAVDRAVGTRGNALVNQVTYTSAYTFLLGTIQCFKVKGDVVTLR